MTLAAANEVEQHGERASVVRTARTPRLPRWTLAVQGIQASVAMQPSKEPDNPQSPFGEGRSARMDRSFGPVPGRPRIDN